MAVSRQVVSIEVDVSGLLAKLDPVLYRPAIANLIGRLAMTAERAAKGRVPVDMGALRRSIVSDVQPMHATVYTTLSYAGVVEEGRRPGGRPPPPEALVGWMRRHGMEGDPWPLARAIGRRGIKGRFFMRAGLNAAKAVTRNLMWLAVRQVEAAWRKERA